MEKNEIDQTINFIEQMENEDLSFIFKEKDGINIIQRLTASELLDIIQNSIVAIREAEKLNFLYSCSRYFIRRDIQEMMDIFQVFQKIIQGIKNKNLINIETWSLFLQTYILQVGIYSLLVKNEKPDVIIDVNSPKNGLSL